MFTRAGGGWNHKPGTGTAKRLESDLSEVSAMISAISLGSSCSADFTPESRQGLKE